jgi:hypothetical protein
LTANAPIHASEVTLRTQIYQGARAMVFLRNIPPHYAALAMAKR